MSDTIPPLVVDEQWPQRAAALRQQFATELYGHNPVPPCALDIMEDDLGRDVDGIICRQLVLGLSGIANRIYVLWWYPEKNNRDLPCFIGLNFRGNHCVHSDPGILFAPNDSPDEPPGWMACRYTEDKRGVQAARWPVKEICDAGFSVATVFCADFAPDHKTLFDSGFAGAYAPGHAGTWRTISRWSWGLSCLRLTLSKFSELDAQRMIAIGHSRLGKTALWAAAQDTDFAATCVNNSGCNGAALARRKHGERFRDIGSNFPHWFLPSLQYYFDREDEFPLDQHQLIACVAPRPCYVASADQDHGADPEGEFTSLRLAAPAWEYYGKTPLAINSDWPRPDQHVHADTAYHLRIGKHDINIWDWQHYLTYLSQKLP